MAPANDTSRNSSTILLSIFAFVGVCIAIYVGWFFKTDYEKRWAIQKWDEGWIFPAVLIFVGLYSLAVISIVLIRNQWTKQKGRCEDQRGQPQVENIWEKLPERISPFPGNRNTIIAVTGFMFNLVIWICAIISFFQTIAKGTFSAWHNDTRAVGTILLLWIVLAFILSVRKLINGWVARKKFQKNQNQTLAQILRCRVKVQQGSYREETYIYQLQLKFMPISTSASEGICQYEVEINESLYEKLSSQEAVKITYATEDPRIFILEGELL